MKFLSEHQQLEDRKYIGTGRVAPSTYNTVVLFIMFLIGITGIVANQFQQGLLFQLAGLDQRTIDFAIIFMTLTYIALTLERIWHDPEPNERPSDCKQGEQTFRMFQHP